MVIIVGYFDNTKLFCGSRDQLYTIGPGNETAFCTLSGITSIHRFYLSEVEIVIIIHTHRSCVFLLFSADLRVGSIACWIFVLGSEFPLQLQTAKHLRKDTLCPHHQCPAGPTATIARCSGSLERWILSHSQSHSPLCWTQQ